MESIQVRRQLMAVLGAALIGACGTTDGEAQGESPLTGADTVEVSGTVLSVEVGATCGESFSTIGDS
jgi:hypothetical protein